MLTNIEAHIYPCSRKLLSLKWNFKAVACRQWNWLCLETPWTDRIVSFLLLLVLLWWYPYAPSPWCFLFFPQNEIEHRTEESLASPQHAGPQPAYNVAAANVQGNPFSFGNIAAALDSRMDETDQTRNSGISNALPCPLRQNFPSNYLSQPSGYGPMNSLPNVNGPRNHSLQNQDSMRYNLWGRCGYALWWSLKVRTMWRFDSSLSRSIQVFTIWSSLAGAFRVSYLLAEGTPSICDDVFVIYELVATSDVSLCKAPGN